MNESPLLKFQMELTFIQRLQLRFSRRYISLITFVNTKNKKYKHTTMKFLSSLFSIGVFFASTLCANAQDDYVRGEDPAADAIRDMQTGMAGIQQAAKDPVLMAQLMQDLQVRLPMQDFHIEWH